MDGTASNSSVYDCEVLGKLIFVKSLFLKESAFICLLLSPMPLSNILKFSTHTGGLPSVLLFSLP